MPSVVFLNRSYPPDPSPTGQLAADLADDLVDRGWGVTVVTTGATGQTAADSSGGVRIVRVPVRGGGRRKRSSLARHLRTIVGLGLAMFRLPRHDVAVVMTDPPLLILPVLVIARLRRTRLVFWVQDLFPEQAERLGLLRSGGMVDRGLHKLAALVHRRCDAVVAAGERIGDVLLKAGTPPGRLWYLGNWVDTEDTRPLSPETDPFRERHGLAGKFVILYSGSFDRAHTFTAVMEAAWLLREEVEVLFLFIGDGEDRPRLEAMAWRYGLENVRFLDDLPPGSADLALSAADAALITENPAVAGLRAPGEIHRVLASSRPVLFVGSEQSEVARIVAADGCGLVIPADDAEALASEVLRLKDDPESMARMGAKARMAAVARYDRRLGMGRWHDMLERVARSSGRRGSEQIRRHGPAQNVDRAASGTGG